MRLAIIYNCHKRIKYKSLMDQVEYTCNGNPSGERQAQRGGQKKIGNLIGISPMHKSSIDSQASQRHLSADLAHLSEPESPSPQKLKGVPNYKSFVLEEIDGAHKNQSSSKLSDSRVYSKTTLRIHQPQELTSPAYLGDGHQLSSQLMPQPIATESQLNFTNSQTPSGQRLLQKKSIPAAKVQVKIQAVEMGQHVVAINLRSIGTNRFRSESMTPSVNQYSNEIRGITTGPQISSQQRQNRGPKFESQYDCQAGAHKKPKPKPHGREALPAITLTKNKSQLDHAGHQYDPNLNKSAGSFGESASVQVKLQGSTRGQKSDNQRGLVPAKIDIGVMGHMPFDEQLLLNRKPQATAASVSSNEGGSLLVIKTHRRDKSQIGSVFHKTVFSGAMVPRATVSDLSAPNLSARASGSEGGHTQGDSVSTTNHPGTLLKNFNPKIAPKNKEAEHRRKKVQNLLKHQRNDHSQIIYKESVIASTQQSPRPRLQRQATKSSDSSLVVSPESTKLHIKYPVAEEGPQGNFALQTHTTKGPHKASELGKKVNIPTLKGARKGNSPSVHRSGSVGSQSPRVPFSFEQMANGPPTLRIKDRNSLPPVLETSRATKVDAGVEAVMLSPELTQGSCDTKRDDGHSKIQFSQVCIETDTPRDKTHLTQADGQDEDVTGLHAQLRQNGTLLLKDDPNTATHRILVRNESIGADEEVGSEVRSPTTKRPSLMVVTERNETGAREVAADEYSHKADEPVDKQDAESSTQGPQSSIAHAQYADSLSYRGQMLSLLQTNLASEGKGQENYSDQQATKKNLGHDRSHSVCLCTQPIISKRALPGPLKKVTVPVSKGTEIKVEEPNTTKTPLAILRMNQGSLEGEVFEGWQAVTAKPTAEKEAPFRNSLYLSTHQRFDNPSATRDSVNTNSPEQHKIKQIVKELMQQQKLQLKEGFYKTGSNMVGASGLSIVPACNKHKTMLTNLVAPKERSGTHTRLASMQVSTRDIQNRGFVYPKLEMLSQLHTVGESGSFGTQSAAHQAQQTMFGFKKKRTGCSPLPPPESLRAPSEDVARLNDYGNQEGGFCSPWHATFKTSKAPLKPRLLLNEASRPQKRQVLKKTHKGAALTSESGNALTKKRFFNMTSSQMLSVPKVNKDGLKSTQQGFGSLVSELHDPANLQNYLDAELANFARQTSKIAIKETNERDVKSGFGHFASLAQDEIRVEKARLIDSEIGKRSTFAKETAKAGARNARQVKTRVGETSPRAKQKNQQTSAHGSDLINSGASIVISKIQEDSVAGGRDKNEDLKRRSTENKAILKQKPFGRGLSTVANQEVVDYTGILCHAQPKSLQTQQQQRSSPQRRNNKSHAAQRSFTSQLSKKTSQQAEQSSVVQMIELELPNVHQDETQVSPQRVKVLSREYTPSSNKRVQEEHVNESQPGQPQGGSPSRNEGATGNRVAGLSKRDECTINEHSFENLNEAVILQNMSATIATNDSKQSSQPRSRRSPSQSPPAAISKGKALHTSLHRKNAPEFPPLSRLGEQARASSVMVTGFVPQDDQQVTQNDSRRRSENLERLKSLKLQHKGKSAMQYVQNLRMLADQVNNRGTMDEKFTLTSEPVAIHSIQDPKEIKLQYFSNLKERDQRLKQAHQEQVECQMRATKDQLQMRKLRNLRRRGAQTQLTRAHPSKIKIDVKQRSRERQASGGRIAHQNETARIEFGLKAGSGVQVEATNQDGSKSGRNNGHNKTGEDQMGTRESGAQSGNKRTLFQLDEVESPGLYREDQSPPSKEGLDLLSSDHEAKGGINRRKIDLRSLHNTRKVRPSNLTCTTVGLPDKQLNVLERKLYRGAELPVPVIGQALEQINASRRNKMLSQVHTQRSLLGMTTLTPNKHSEMSFVQLKQQQLENQELARIGSSVHNKNTLHENRAFRASIKKKQPVGAREPRASLSQMHKSHVSCIQNQHQSLKNQNLWKNSGDDLHRNQSSIDEPFDLKGHKLMSPDSRKPQNLLLSDTTQSQKELLVRQLKRELSRDKETLFVDLSRHVKKRAITKEAHSTEHGFKPWSRGNATLQDLSEVQQKLFNKLSKQSDAGMMDQGVAIAIEDNASGVEGAVHVKGVAIGRPAHQSGQFEIVSRSASDNGLREEGIGGGSGSKQDAAMVTDEVNSLAAFNEAEDAAAQDEERAFSSFDRANSTMHKEPSLLEETQEKQTR